jgi:glycine/D-amino acid oxidase-like deaminating enzyme
MDDTVIIGAGIIGCATAYYLSKIKPDQGTFKITLIDSSPELFECASGRAGGFLASDCAESTSTYP